MAAATEFAPARAGRPARRRSGPDRLTVVLLTLSAFLCVLALLAAQIQAAAPRAGHRVVLIRRIYQTRIVETLPGPAGAGTTGGNVVTQQAVSSSGSTAAPAPTTRASG